MGITFDTLKSYRGKNITCEDVKNLTKQEAEAIYKKNYWDKLKGDQINSQSIAEILFDYGVLSGIGKASKVIQELVGVSADGVIGPKTIEAINNQDPKNLFDRIKMNRRSYFDQIVKNNPSQKRFLLGWNNRNNSFVFVS
jgi:lysozyme family protein